METVTRTIRFKKVELKRIEEFLRENPIFDFSSLVRLSVETFIANPMITIKPVPTERQKAKQVDL